jgi:integrase
MDIQPAPLVTDTHRRGRRGARLGKPRSLRIVEWPKSDRFGWEEACRPGQRLQRGGAASHLARVSQADIANRYGLYLDSLQRNGRLDLTLGVVTLVNFDNVTKFIAELNARVRSVTVWNSVYKLRRAAQLIAPSSDFGWLADIEKDIALVMVPRSKADRLVLAERLVEAGLVLIKEAEMFGTTPMARAAGVRNGLVIALLALHPIRIKNFAVLRIGDTFVNIEGRWWLRIPADDTKSNLVDQRQVPEFMTDLVNRYINIHHKVIRRGNAEQSALWISSTTGRQLTVKNLGTLISKLTRETIGVDVSPHLFRTAGVSTAAVYGSKYPHLGSALMGHRDARVTEERYNHAICFETGDAYAAITETYRSRPKHCE